MTFQPNALYYGDCLEVMRPWPDASVDLVYLDPPFNSKADYNILFGSHAAPDAQQTLAFEDTWRWDENAAARVAAMRRAAASPARAAVSGLHGMLGNCGMLAYLSYMAERLIETKRVLKETGSIYLHCDPTASHYLKILMDAVFGHGNFRNEIVWRIGWVSGFKTRKRGWIRNHDTILYYIMSRAAADTFNKEYIPYPPGYVRRNGTPPAGEGIPIEDTWNCSGADVLDSIMIKSFSTEKLGYPTQKPVALLERIVKASSPEGGIVLDPFCGCGTTVDAANRSNRRWIGIDISPFAIDLIKYRRLKDKNIPVNGVPVDMETARTMARDKPLDFEKWAVARIPGMIPNASRTGDRGVDGRGYLLDAGRKPEGLVLAQVKGGKFTLGGLRDFLHAARRDNAAMAVFVTLDKVTSRNALAEAREAGDITIGAKRYPKVQLWSIAEHFDNREPNLPPLADPFTGKAMQRDIYAR